MNKRIWLALIASSILVTGLPCRAVVQVDGSQAAGPEAFKRAMLTARYARDPRLMLPLPGRPPFLANRGSQSYRPQVDSSTNAAANAGDFVTFDPPGSTSTLSAGINPAGVIIGDYVDASGATRGFVRAPDGTFTTFDAPGSQYTVPTDITPGGVITGWDCDTSTSLFTANCHGFLRARDGAFTVFDAPPGGYIFGSIYTGGGQPPSINPAGTIAGTYVDASFVEHGFLRTHDGAVISFDFPGASFTEALAINPAGLVVGDFCDATTCYRGYVRAPDGTFTVIDGSIPMGINPAGAITGFSFDVSYAYLRNPDGTIVTFSPPGSNYTSPSAINPAGAITGYYQDAIGFHGFLRAPDSTITTFDAPGSNVTAPESINPAGEITGVYYDASGVLHGFLRRKDCDADRHDGNCDAEDRE